MPQNLFIFLINPVLKRLYLGVRVYFQKNHYQIKEFQNLEFDLNHDHH